MPTPDVLSKGNLFDPELVNTIVDLVKGKSALAALCGMTPIPFNGMKEFTFSMDDEVDLVAENGAKSRGSVALTPRTITPLKIEYGARVSDEFLYASAEAKIDILREFTEGFAKKAARGLDIMAFHGVNPRSKQAATLIGANHFDNGVTVIAPSVGDTANTQVENAIAAIQGYDYDPTGIAISPAFRSDLSKLTYQDGRPMFPELTWGKMAGSLNGLAAACNNTLSFNSSPDLAVIGDFETAFKWGYSKQIPVEVIKYGDPDNTGNDLKGYNQVYIRAELYLGWGILDKNAFAVLRPASNDNSGGGETTEEITPKSTTKSK